MLAVTRAAVGQALETCALAWPASGDVSTTYRQACRLLDVRLSAEILIEASYAMAVGFWLVGMLVFVAGPAPLGTVFGIGVWVLAAGIAIGGRYGPPFLATVRRITALGAAPSLVTMLVLGATLWPNCERAATFAAQSGDGLLAKRLATHTRRANGTPQSGLDAFVAEWEEQFPALRRAVERIQRATTSPPAERMELLESARGCILDGTRNELSRFAADLRAPVTGLYAFGVLLPLALVSLLPAVTATGIPVTGTLLVVTYGLLLPAGLVVASCWLLGRRPVAFPPTTVPRSHPDVRAQWWKTAAGGIGTAVIGWLVTGAFVPGWGQPLASLGFGTGSALILHYRPVTQVRDCVEAVESGLPDALTALGRRIDSGQSVEASLIDVSDEIAAPTGTVLDATARQQQVLGVGVEAAFRGEHGTLQTIPSEQARRAASLLGTAAAIGPPAGETVVRMGGHLEELQRIEQQLQRELAQVTGTLSNTAALFGPLIGGITVSLAATMGSDTALAAPTSGPLGPVVGWYVLVLAVVLTTLATALTHGLDRARVGYRVGLALTSATGTYLTAVFATGLFV